MGYYAEKLEVHARVSRHNSPRDLADDAAWNAMFAEIQAIVEKPEYQRIDPYLMGTKLEDRGDYGSPQEVACPRCKVKPGSPCRATTGDVQELGDTLATWHDERVEARCER